jgi:hypothetical protein
MNIEISTNEYRDLLDILHVADVVMSGHRREDDVRSRRHRALIRKLYALAEGEGLGNLISYNEASRSHTPTVEFERNSVAHILLDEFGDHLFWDILIQRLIARDAEEIAGGTERLSAMSEGERQAIEAPLRSRYVEEFSKNGVANLAVIEQFSVGGGAPIKTSD